MKNKYVPHPEGAGTWKVKSLWQGVATWAVAALAVMMFAVFANAQTTTGTMGGSVRDPSGNSVPGAHVTITNESNGDVRRVDTSTSGDFSFPSLLPATYTVQVEMTGFQTYKSTGNVLVSNGRLSLGDIPLAVGSVTTTVEVAAQAAQVSTESAENSAVITREQFSMVSMKSRDLTNFLRLLPGVQMQADTDAFGGSSGFGAQIGAVQGVRSDNQNLTVDGIAGNDMGAPAGLSGQVNSDAVQEVNVLLGNYQAEYGRNPGANISMTTRSGTKEFHGSTYYYGRNDYFNANDFIRNKSADSRLNSKPAIYKFHTFGATFGGPFFSIPKVNTDKNKVFFFYSYDQTTDKLPSGTIFRLTQPTEAERRGDFSQSVSAAKPTIPGTTTPYAGGIIPASEISKVGQALINLYPQPNTTLGGTTYNYESIRILKVPNWQHVFRVDDRLTDKDLLYFRGTIWHKDTYGPGGTVGYGTTPNWPFLESHYQYYDDSFAVNYTRTWTPQIISEFTFGARHSTEREDKDDFGAVADKASRTAISKSCVALGGTASDCKIGYLFPGTVDNPFDVIPTVSYGGTALSNATGVGFGGRFGIPGSDVQFNGTHATTFVYNRHRIKAGFYWNRGRDIEGRSGNTYGTFDFGTNSNSTLSTGNPFANQLTGNFYSYTEASARRALLQFRTNISWYIQDTWKVTRKLTLDYGLRFDKSGWFFQNDGIASVFVPDQYNRAAAGRLYYPGKNSAGQRVGVDLTTGNTVPQALIGAFVPGSYNAAHPTGMVLQSDPGTRQGFIQPAGLMFMPRFGLAYDVFGNGKMALRMGGGVFYQTEDDGVLYGNKQVPNPPQVLTASVFNSNITSLTGNIAGSVFPGGTNGLDLTTGRPVTYSYDFGIQRDLGRSLLVDIKYVGSLSRHLGGIMELNTLPVGARGTPNVNGVVPTAASLDATTGKALIDNLLRPYPGYAGIQMSTRNLTSNYNALQASLNRRFAKGVQFGMAYTYSKSLDYGSGVRNSVTPLYRPQRDYYGPSTFDQRQVMTMNWQYDIPSMKSGNGVVKHLTNGWQISGVGSFSNGNQNDFSLSFNSGVDTIGGGDPQRVSIGCNPNLGHFDRTADRYFDTSCVVSPGATVGNSGRGVYQGPGRTNFDTTLFRNFSLGSEKRTMSFRWELYNVFNHTQFSSIDDTAKFTAATGVQTSTTFGQASAAYQARQMQFSLRIKF